MSDEFNNLQLIASVANYGKGIDAYTTEYTSEIFKRYIPNSSSSILELGSSEGVMTDLLATNYSNYTIVEAVSEFCERIQLRHKHIKVNNCLFEEFKTDRKYDVIILSHVLEHVSDPVEILKFSRKLLNKDGVILAAVPNSNSIHRQAAVLMGLLEKQDQLGETDKLIGHRRVYNLERLSYDFKSAGIDILDSGGYFIKSLTNKQMEESFSKEMIYAFMKLGESYPEIAAEIFIIGK